MLLPANQKSYLHEDIIYNFVSNIKYFGYKIRIQFSKNSLKKNYSTKKLSAYIVYDLDH